jgi:uncharacterized protein
MDIAPENKIKLFRWIFFLVIVLCVYFALKSLGELRVLQNPSSATQATITLSGHGEVNGVPNIAGVDFTVESTQSTESAASDDVNKKVAQMLGFLKSAGVEQKDIQTSNYSSYPKYSNPQVCPMYIMQGGSVPPCTPGDSQIIGYTVSEAMTVKVRVIDNTSKIIDGINKIGVTNMNGPNLTIDNPDTLKTQARQKAIADAQSKAEELAHELHARLGKVVSFSESGSPSPMPVFYSAKAEGSASASVPSQIETGQNTITSDVSITYEIN